MGWALLSMILVSILIGYQAQSMKGRTGAAWGALALLVMFVLFVIFWPGPQDVASADPAARASLLQVIEVIGQAGFAAIIAIVLGGGAMAAIVATLPSKKTKAIVLEEPN